MSDPAATRLAPETDASIRESLDALGRAVQIARITNDPLLHTLEALASTVRAQHRLFVDGTLTLRQVLSEAQPLSAEERAALLREVSASAKDGPTRERTAPPIALCGASIARPRSGREPGSALHSWQAPPWRRPLRSGVTSGGSARTPHGARSCG